MLQEWYEGLVYSNEVHKYVKYPSDEIAKVMDGCNKVIRRLHYENHYVWELKK